MTIVSYFHKVRQNNHTTQVTYLIFFKKLLN